MFEFAWMGNRDVPDDIFKGRGSRLPNSPFGLNCYQHLHHAVILSALNPPPAHFSFLDALGFDSREVKRAGYWQAVYQAVMRISPRNPDDTNPKTVIVMDRATAEWLAEHVPWLHGRSARWPRRYASARASRAALVSMIATQTASGRAATSSRPSYAWRSIWSPVAIGQRGIALRRSRNCARQMSEFGHGKDTALSTTGPR